MKCVQHPLTHYIHRVPNEVADRYMRQGTGWKYVPKRLWKTQKMRDAEREMR